MQSSHWFKPTDRIFCTDGNGTLKVHSGEVTCDLCCGRHASNVIPMSSARAQLPTSTPTYAAAAPLRAAAQ